MVYLKLNGVLGLVVVRGAGENAELGQHLGRDADAYFSHENFAKQAYAPLVTAQLRDKVDVSANVDGGGVTGQAGAVAQGIARALQKLNPELRAVLKKAGQPGARKRFQFSKR